MCIVNAASDRDMAVFASGMIQVQFSHTILVKYYMVICFILSPVLYFDIPLSFSYC